ncbi:hypothetical protein OWR29_02065 [Actinoplanes sp. Pm04-4]|uniref:Lipoprotein n=1 Tax=Paractinoplanes pyxinae TaxID=2997416 RepID=A0ABT4AR98_9ACTN|nr:hypothetical protein [Actinoplanes pyxinae]MCY1136766.1 hypothetical protein [Actinoplanes pyxinae]
MTVSRGLAVVAALMIAAAGCDVSVRPAPETTVAPSPSPARKAAIGKKIDVQRGNLKLSATLKPTDGPDGPEGEDALFFELSIAVRSGSYVFFPSLLKYYGSEDKPPQPRDTGYDEAMVLILQGGSEQRTVSVSNPASGPNGDLVVALYHQDGTRLATWTDR